MSRDWKIGITLFMTVVIACALLVVGSGTIQVSAYAACRRVAMNTKGYARWQHKQTEQETSAARVTFSDGFNDLSCRAIGVGPFWMAVNAGQTLVGCARGLESGKIKPCPVDYFGVSP